MSGSPDRTRVHGGIARPGELCPHGDHGPADQLVLGAGDHVNDRRQLEQVQQVVRVAGAGPERGNEGGNTKQS